MDAPFSVGDVVVCVLGKQDHITKRPFLVEGEHYTISRIYLEEDEWFVSVGESTIKTLFASRFEPLASAGKTKVERKIKQMEQRFIKRQEEKKNESMCCL